MAKTEQKTKKMGLLAILFSISISFSLADELTLDINTKRPLSITSDKFLSFTLDPTVILTADLNSNVLRNNLERSINMGKALSPAYIRIGGPRSNSYVFERELFPQSDQRSSGLTFSENNWSMIHQWAEKSGLNLIACIAPQRNENGAHTSWDSRNALDLISFSDNMGYNTSWQLGYECQTRCDIPGGDLGMDVMRLRSMLDAYPRYSSSIISGPDVVGYKSKLHQKFLLDYFNVAGSALSAITWHPDLSGASYTNNGVSVHHDNLFTDKENLYKVLGHSTFKKPLWIAESKSEEGKTKFIGALVWARRLGNAAKLGAQVLMRQPDNSNLFKPTPDFWVSLLHKKLVGPQVLDTKILAENHTNAYFYCQCTRPSSKYKKGSLTVFGINLTPTKIVASLKGLKIKELHKYILLPGFDATNRMLAETVLLNNEPLNLKNGKEVPEIKPTVSNSERGLLLKLPSGGIGFWVIPNLKLKSCLSYEEGDINKTLLKRLARRLEEDESEEDAAHEELTTFPEEVRPFLWQNRMRRQRKNRLGLEEENDPRFRKLDIKKDLEKLENLFKRRDTFDNWKFRNDRSRGFKIYDNPSKESSEESPFFKSNINSMDSGEKIRAKLEKYKTQLAEYESRKNNPNMWRQKSFSGSKNWQTNKAIAALSLISKVEDSLKNMDPNKSIRFTTLNRESNLNPENDYDVLMDEVLKTDKAKRTIIPTKTEDQFNALYEILSDHNPLLRRMARKADYVTRDSSSLATRITRDLENKFGEDPLYLRRGIFKKFQQTPESGLLGLKFLKRENGLPIFVDPKNIENKNLYGFSYRKPIIGFPKGDVYIGSSDEKKNPWDNKRFLKKTKKTSGRSNLEDLWIQEEPNYQNYNFGPRYSDSNYERTLAANNLRNYYPQPISSPPTNFDLDIPKTQSVHTITKKSQVESIGEENAREGNQNMRLKREVGDMNILLNQEMFHQDEDECQFRFLRGTEKSDDKKDLADPKVIIIGSKENIDREELVEDGSGAHVADEVIEIVENAPLPDSGFTESEKVKRAEKPKVENNVEGSSTEKAATLAVGRMPETQEELNTSTVETVNRDTRDSTLSLRQLFRQAITGKDSSTAEGSGSTSGGDLSKNARTKTNADVAKTHTKGSSPGSTESAKTAEPSADKSPGSAKQVRQTPGRPVGFPGAPKSGQLSDIIGSAAAKKSPGATKFSLGIREPVLKRLDGQGIQLPKLGQQPNLGKTAAKLKQSIEKASADLRNRVPPLKPLNPLKRESTPAERFDVFKKARETRLAALKALRDEADKIRTKKAPDVFEKTFAAESAKLEEFRKRRNEELLQLRQQLRDKRAEIMSSYKPELLDVVMRNKEDLEKQVERREAGVKKIFDDLVQTVDSNLNVQLPVIDFLKPLHDLQKRTAAEGDGDNLGFFKLPDIFRSKKAADENDEDLSSLEDEGQGPRIFKNIRDSFPLVFRSPRAEDFYPSETYRSPKEDGKNLLEERNLNSNEGASSGEDTIWDFMDGRFRRIRSSDAEIDEKEEAKDLKDEHTRRRRDTEDQVDKKTKNTSEVQSTDEMKVSQISVKKSKSEGCNFLCLKKDSSEICDDFEEKLYKIVRDEDHFTAVPVDNLELAKSISKKAFLKDQYVEKKYKNQKYDTSEYNPELYSGMFQNYPVLQVMRPGILEMTASQPIQHYWSQEEYANRKIFPDYNDYYFGMYDHLPRIARDQNNDFTPKNSSGNQKIDSKKSPKSSYPDLMRYLPFTSRPLTRRRRQVDNEIVKPDTSTNEIWSNADQPKIRKDLEKKTKFFDEFGKSLDYKEEVLPKKNEKEDSDKEIKWTAIPMIPTLLSVEPVENLKNLKTEMEGNKGLDTGAMVISITVTDLMDSNKNTPTSFVASPKFFEQREPLMTEDRVQPSILEKRVQPLMMKHQEVPKSSTQLENLTATNNFVHRLMNSMDSFLSYMSSWSPNFSF